MKHKLNQQFLIFLSFLIQADRICTCMPIAIENSCQGVLTWLPSTLTCLKGTLVIFSYALRFDIHGCRQTLTQTHAFKGSKMR